MRRWMKHVASGLASSCLAFTAIASGLAVEDEYDPLHVLRNAQYSQQRDVRFQLSSMMQDEQGIQARQPAEETLSTSTLTGQISTGPQFDDYFQTQTATASQEQAPTASEVGQSQLDLLQPQDSAAALTSSSVVQTVATQRRSPVALEPYVRGYRWGQLYSQFDGAYFFTVRPDLDSMLNKIDPSQIEQMTVIPGPYGLRYGPGFSFITVETLDTPRYNNGFEVHHRTGFSVRTNGDQIFGRETIYGGSCDYGFLFNYGNRTGVDYEAGDGTRIPSSYKMQTFLGQIGFDLTEDSRVEFRYNRLDGSGIEIAAQFFDIDFMTTDSYGLSYIADDPVTDSRTRADAWYNRSRLLGTTSLDGKRGAFPVLDRVESALDDAYTGPGVVRINDRTNSDGDATSAGLRGYRTYGQDDWVQLTLGADGRYTEQHIRETYFFDPPQITQVLGDVPFETNMPRADMVNPGTFMEWKLPMLAYWDVAIGGRADWVRTTADASDLRTDTNLDPGQLDQEDVLYSFYATNDLDLTENLSTRFGFGYAQRPPTLLERYADGLFLGLIQSGFSRLIGQADLRKERDWQMDWAVQGDWERVRGRAAVFHAWILDYVTYEGNLITDPAGARLLRTTNTDLATLAGWEVYGEWDATEYVTLFGTSRYLDGRDRVINAPLPHILPLEHRTGFRLHNPANEVWGLEMGMRLVDNQDRTAGIRTVGNPNVIVPIEQPTPGFTTFYLRSFYNVTPDFNLIAGVDNLFDRRYLEHVDLRIPADGGFGPTEVLSPGITPYFGIEIAR